MSLPIRLVDGKTGVSASVSKLGQFTTAPFAYDETVFNELATDNVAFNFYTPKAGKQFVVTGISAVADKQVSSTVSADVVVYEATSSSTTTVDKILFQTAMVQDQINILIPLNILVTAGKYINAKTTDDDIHMTIMGYYIPIL